MLRSRTLPSAGLQLSELALGTLTWGRDTTATDAARQLELFHAAGGSTIDTSPVFGQGNAEEVLGSILHAYERSSLVLCTRAGYTQRSGGFGYGCSVKDIHDSLRASLERLKTSYVDILTLPGYDGITPDEEIADALGEALNSGHAYYVALRDFPLWHVARIDTLMRERKLGRISALHMEGSLISGTLTSDVMEYCAHTGIGILASSALGRGLLTGKYREGVDATSRAASLHMGEFAKAYFASPHLQIVEAAAQAGEGLDRPIGEIALSWLLANPLIGTAIVGARTSAQLADVLEYHLAPLPDVITDVLTEVAAQI